MIGNFLAWWLHAAVLISAGILGARWFGWRHPQSRLRFFQLLLAVTFLLPIAEPWRPPPLSGLEPGAVTVRTGPFVPALSGGTALPFPAEAVLAAVLLAGALLRCVQLTAGLLKLGALRRRGSALTVEGMHGVEVREAPGLKGPAAFGWLRPVILLPEGMAPGPIRDAALRHELQHVLRRDWLENLIERVAGALLWFHPMVWWLLERIHLSREQAVDLEVAGAGADRDEYLHSLLASAGLANLPALPVTGFVRRPRHLVERVAFLSKETPMSMFRMAASAAAVALVSTAALLLASFYLPLRLAAQENPNAMGGSPYRLVRLNPEAGEVMLDVTVGGAGEFLDAHVVSGPDALRKLALLAILNWKDPKPTGARRVVPVTMEFVKPGNRGMPPPPPPPPIESAKLEGIDYVGLSTVLQQRAAAVMAELQTGQNATSPQLERLAQELKTIDPMLRLNRSMHQDSGKGVTLRLAVQFGPPGPPQQIRVGEEAAAGNLIHKVDPVYPALALQARIQGRVRFTVTVNREGSIEKMELVSGHPLFLEAAREALAQYKYRPTMLNGNPIAVTTTVDVEFKL